MIGRLLLALLLALAAAAPASAADKRIAFTFDDVPRVPGGLFTPAERTDRLIAALKRARVKQAAFFLNPGNLAEPWGQGGEQRIAAYVAAGHVIGNHSWSHPHLNAMSTDAWLADVDRASEWLKGRAGYRPWLRFPFLDEGTDAAQRDAVRAGLTARGLRNAYVTVDPSDWFLEQLLTDAKAQGKTVDLAALGDLYVKELVGAADHSDQLARDMLHLRPVHVVLMHETDLEALFIEKAVAALRADGWEIVPVDQAFEQPLPDPTGPWIGGNQVSALAAERGASADALPYPSNQTDTLEREFDRHVLHQPATDP